MSAAAKKRRRPGRYTPPVPVEVLDLDDFTEGELANLQRKDVPPRESDRPSWGQS